MNQVGVHAVIAHTVYCTCPPPSQTDARIGYITDFIMLDIDITDITGANAQSAPVFIGHIVDVAGIYTLGSQPHSRITENCVSDIFSPGYAHDPNHWFYLYTDEGSSFITVKDNWTEGEKFLKNANGPGNTWENNGTMVNDSIKANAGLPKEYSYLKEK